MDVAGEFYGLTLDTPTMILPLFLSTLLTVSSNLEELRGLEELIAELRMDMSGLEGEMVNLIERGMTVSSLENQFLTNESKTGVNTGKRLYQMVDRFC